MTDSELIENLGGPTKVAELLNFDKAGGVQRVQNWIARGIPAQVKVDHPEIFMRDWSAAKGLNNQPVIQPDLAPTPALPVIQTEPDRRNADLEAEPVEGMQLESRSAADKLAAKTAGVL